MLYHGRFLLYTTMALPIMANCWQDTYCSGVFCGGSINSTFWRPWVALPIQCPFQWVQSALCTICGPKSSDQALTLLLCIMLCLLPLDRWGWAIPKRPWNLWRSRRWCQFDPPTAMSCHVSRTIATTSSTDHSQPLTWCHIRILRPQCVGWEVCSRASLLT